MCIYPSKYFLILWYRLFTINKCISLMLKFFFFYSVFQQTINTVLWVLWAWMTQTSCDFPRNSVKGTENSLAQTFSPTLISKWKTKKKKKPSLFILPLALSFLLFCSCLIRIYLTRKSSRTLVTAHSLQVRQWQMNACWAKELFKSRPSLHLIITF